jgi:hypothetical protein
MVQLQVAVVGELMMIYLQFGKELKDWRRKFTPKEASGSGSNEKNQTIDVMLLPVRTLRYSRKYRKGCEGSTGCCCGDINPSLIVDTPHCIQVMAICDISASPALLASSALFSVACKEVIRLLGALRWIRKYVPIFDFISAHCDFSKILCYSDLRRPPLKDDGRLRE